MLEQLGSQDERIRTATAAEWTADVDALNVIGFECAQALVLSTAPGLPDVLIQHHSNGHHFEDTTHSLGRIIMDRLGEHFFYGERVW
ncbi:hypothetical protein [Kribbella sp. NPDC006257]|uniref:hypothetical protein n=1 Tax=Kribbella sp. NPDC006257 TaxID=3156738 RepID=UPI0033BDA9E1